MVRIKLVLVTAGAIKISSQLLKEGLQTVWVCWFSSIWKWGLAAGIIISVIGQMLPTIPHSCEHTQTYIRETWQMDEQLYVTAYHKSKKQSILDSLGSTHEDDGLVLVLFCFHIRCWTLNGCRPWKSGWKQPTQRWLKLMARGNMEDHLRVRESASPYFFA